MSPFTKLLEGYKERMPEMMITALFFVVSFVEILAEYYRNIPVIYAVKPLIIPVLVLLYFKTSKKTNWCYVAALLFSWLANLFFVSQEFNNIFVGALLFFVYRALSIYIVLRSIRLPGIFPIVIGCVPFLFIYMYLVNLTYDAIGEGLVIFITQCIMVSFLGGLSIGNYILRSNKASTMLLMSTLFFAVTQFIFVIRLYYINVNIFQPAAMALFVIAQYMFYKFLILVEEQQAAGRMTNELANDSEI